MNAKSIAVRCCGITKSFPAGNGVVEVLHGIDFEVPAGELTMLVGPSGCGKTSLISIIAGILSPTKGTVETCGRLITTLPEAEKVAFRRKAIGFVFQQYNLLPALTAAENAAIPLVASTCSSRCQSGQWRHTTRLQAVSPLAHWTAPRCARSAEQIDAGNWRKRKIAIGLSFAHAVFKKCLSGCGKSLTRSFLGSAAGRQRRGRAMD